MNPVVRKLRELLPRTCPEGCHLFKRPPTDGTAFFPGGDGLWKEQDPNPPFPSRGILVIGSDYGAEGDDEKEDILCRTWKNLGRFFKLAELSPTIAFYTNAWPCLRNGRKKIGRPPASKDLDYTARCKELFLATVVVMEPALIVPLGNWPDAFVDYALGHTNACTYRKWSTIDREPIRERRGITIAPIVHPSLPNHHLRTAVKSLEEANLIRTALGRAMNR